MATHLDLQEQEQVDALKAFWKQYGNLITWVLLLALGAFGAWNGWLWYQRDQAAKAGALYDALDQRAQAGDLDRTRTAFADLRDKFPRTVQAAQGGLLAAAVQHRQGRADDAKSSLTWVAEQGADPDLRQVARLRLAGLLMQAGEHEAALKQLDAVDGVAFAALAADRRGDVLAAMGKTAEARAAYELAWKSMDRQLEIRRLVEAKLTAMGAAPAASEAAQ